MPDNLEIPKSTVSPTSSHSVVVPPAGQPSQPLVGLPGSQGSGEQAPGVPAPQAPVPGPTSVVTSKHVLDQQKEREAKLKSSPASGKKRVLVRVVDGPMRGVGVTCRVASAEVGVMNLQVGNIVSISSVLADNKLRVELAPGETRGEFWIHEDEATVIEGA